VKAVRDEQRGGCAEVMRSDNRNGVCSTT